MPCEISSLVVGWLCWLCSFELVFGVISGIWLHSASWIGSFVSVGVFSAALYSWFKQRHCVDWLPMRASWQRSSGKTIGQADLLSVLRLGFSDVDDRIIGLCLQLAELLLVLASTLLNTLVTAALFMLRLLWLFYLHRRLCVLVDIGLHCIILLLLLLLEYCFGNNSLLVSLKFLVLYIVVPQCILNQWLNGDIAVVVIDQSRFVMFLKRNDPVPNCYR